MKQFLKSTIKKFGYEINKINLNKCPTPSELITKFKSNGSIPWSSGYNEFKEEKIIAALNDEDLLKQFREDRKLPEKFGIGLDERIVEYPWFFSQINKDLLPVNSYLDAGPVMNHKFVIHRARKLAKEVHFSTLSHEKNCFHELDISYIFGDFRTLAVKNDHYNLISCISTLEHVGCNNLCYGTKDFILQTSDKNYEYLSAAKELFRVLAPNGILLITLPFGKFMNLGMIQQFDSEMLNRLINVFGSENTDLTFFKYSNFGWQKTDQESCKHSKFVKWLTESLMKEQFPIPIPLEEDKAAAARAVACLRVKKIP